MNPPIPHKKMLSYDAIQRRVKSIGREITRNYQGKELVIICILKGATLFLGDLLKHIKLPVEVEFMSVSSYKGKTKSSGTAKIEYNFQTSIRYKHVLVVEDIVDTGLTVREIWETIQSKEPYSIGICTLLYRCTEKIDIPYIQYSGFDIGKGEFVIGYGLDYKGLYRNLPYIAILKSKDR